MIIFGNRRCSMQYIGSKLQDRMDFCRKKHIKFLKMLDIVWVAAVGLQMATVIKRIITDNYDG